MTNYGLLISMSGSFEDGTNQRSYYTKKFFARGSEFFFKKPALASQQASQAGTGTLLCKSFLLLLEAELSVSFIKA